MAEDNVWEALAMCTSEAESIACFKAWEAEKVSKCTTARSSCASPAPDSSPVVSAAFSIAASGGAL